MGQVEAVGEAALGYSSQAQGAQKEVLDMPTEQLVANPEYQKLLSQGYSPESSRQILASRVGQQAGMAGGIADMALGHIGGSIMGKIVGEGGGNIATRFLKGGLTEKGQEALQSTGEQLGQNIAEQQQGFNVPTWGGVGEQAAAGAVVGFVSGGTMAGALGKSPKQMIKERQDILNQTADSAEFKADNGVYPSQAAALNSQQKADQKELSPVQQNIVIQASSKGLDPSIALAISSLETGGSFNPTLKNKNSTAHGLYQMLDGTWNQYGGGDRNDVNLQISHGIDNLVASSTQLSAEIGRTPNATEVYLAQLLGAGGAASVIKAGQNSPNKSMLDVVRAYDPANAEAIVNNNGMKGMTVGQAIASWDEKMNRQLLKLGLNPVANQATLSEEDSFLNELDAEMTAADAQPLTAREITDAQQEQDQIDQRNIAENPAQGEVSAAIDAQDSVLYQEPPGEANVEPTLPTELRSSPPIFYHGANPFNIQFDSDIDRAAYHVSGKQTERTNDYLKFLQDSTGMTPDEIKNYGRDIRKLVREAAAAHGKPETGNMGNVRIASTQQGKFNEGYVSNDERKSRDKYNNPNDSIPFTQTPILASTNPEHVGGTLKGIRAKPGDVIAISQEQTEPGSAAPADYVRAVQSTLQNWVQRFAPSMKLIASFRTDRQPGQKGGAVETAWFIPRGHKGSGFYQINARPLYNFGITEDGSRNSTTQAKAAYSLAHEFGHALVEHEFLQGLTQDQAEFIKNLGLWDYVPADMIRDIAKTSPERAKVLSEYNALKYAAQTNSMTGAEWASKWLSPWKVAHGNGKTQGINSFLNMFLGDGSTDLSASQLATIMHTRGDMLSFHEYMAEQMSRYAQSENIFKGTELGGENFFKTVLQKLKDFFKAMKAQKVIAPGTEFKNWVDSLTVANQQSVGQSSPKGRKGAAKTAAAGNAQASNKVEPTPLGEAAPVTQTFEPAKQAEELPPPIVPPDPANTQAAVEALGPSEGQAQARAMLNNELSFLRVSDPTLWRHMSDLVRTGQLEEFKSEVALQVDPELLHQMRWDTGEPSDEPWKETIENLDKLPTDGAAKGWISEGFRRLADAKYLVMTMTQMAYANPDVAGLQHIKNMFTLYKSAKAVLEEEATKIGQEWSKMGKEQRGKMEKAMRAEFDSGENWFERSVVNGKVRFIPSDKVRTYAAKEGLSEDTIGLWMRSKNSYVQHMKTLHQILRRRAEARFAESPGTLRSKLKELATTFEQVIDTPFLPQTRFGQYAIKVVNKGGQIVHLEFFENKKDRDAGVTSLKSNLQEGHKVLAHNYSLSSSVLRTVPTQFLADFANELELTRDQKKELKEMTDVATRNPLIRKYSTQLSKITGANKDLLRSYADFMWHDSTNLAKMQVSAELKKGLTMINEDRTAASDDFDRHDELSKVYDFADKYVKHFMWPADDQSKIRSFVVMKQLWGNVKTALANVNSLAQLWSVASTRQGLWAGTRTTTSVAFSQIKEGVDRLMDKARGDPADFYKSLAPDEREAMQWAQSRGVLDETFAAQLASIATSSTLYRLNPANNPMMKRIMWAGMLPQHAVENYTRRVSFLVSYKGYRATGMSQVAAQKAAMQDTLLLQGDNSLVNRPQFMRGKNAKFFIYYGYMQNMLYLMGGGYERARRNRENLGLEPKSASGRFASETVKMWMAYAFLGGLMGLPGAEDLDAILGLVASKLFGKHFSLKEHAYMVANTIAKNAGEFGLDINPRSIVHGTLADATAFGLLPGIDMSASMSMGQALPGAGGIGSLGQKGGGYKFLIGAMGPLGREVDNILTLVSDDPSLSKAFQMMAPSGLSNFTKAWIDNDASQMYPSGGKVIRDPVTGEVRDRTTGERIGQLMGFIPSQISGNKELHYMQKEQADFWVNRRNNLLTQYWEAVLQDDREAVADARSNIMEYNQDAPGPMKLMAKDISASVKARQARKRADERGVPTSKRSREMYQQTADLFKAD